MSEIIQRAVYYNNLFGKFSSYECEVEHPVTGTTLTNIVFERDDSVAAVLYNPETMKLLLVSQFRVPVYIVEERVESIELVAGSVDRDGDLIDIIRSEILEEVGYEVSELRHSMTFYVSPGACTERIHLFYGEYSNKDRISEGGGLKEQNEYIKVVELKYAEVFALIMKGEIVDAKTIIGLFGFTLSLI